MSIPQEPDKAKLVIGVFLKDKLLIRKISDKLEEEFGPLDTVSPWIPFDYTSYYEKELGKPLFRRIFTFKNLIYQGNLPGIKRYTNALELQCSAGEGRSVNIDPGYLLESRFILATGKDYSHRVYIGDGIYADLTLMFAKGEFTTLPWTYPDYANHSMLEYLGKIRDKYKRDLLIA